MVSPYSVTGSVGLLSVVFSFPSPVDDYNKSSSSSCAVSYAAINFCNTGVTSESRLAILSTLWLSLARSNSLVFLVCPVSHYLGYDIYSLKLWFENKLHPFTMHFLSIGFYKRRNKQRMTTFFAQQQATQERTKKDSSNNQNGNKIETHHWPFYMPNPDADLCMCLDLMLDKKNCEKSGLGHRGPWAAGVLRVVLLAKACPKNLFPE